MTIKHPARVASLILLFMLAFCVHALAAGITEPKVTLYTNEFPLDEPIRCVAVDSQGNVAIKSGSTQAECDYIISVFSKDGAFLYGYKVRFTYERGFGKLFFDENDTLCYHVSYSAADGVQRAVMVFEPRSDEYNLITEGGQVFGEVQYVGDIPIVISPNAQYATAECTESRYVLRNITTDELFAVYNQSEAYEEAAKIRNKTAILVGCGAIAFVVLLGYFLSRCKDNR